MAITIIDSFSVSVAGPIDNRMVTKDAADRVAMGLTSFGNPYSFVYDGLKVFQTDNRTNWIWNTGLGTWSSDNAGSVNVDVNKVPYLSFWTASYMLGSAPIHITQSDNLQTKKFLYFGGSQSLPYDLVVGASDTNWLTLASSNNFKGTQIRSNTNLSDKINSGGQITHQFSGDTTKSNTKLFTSSGYAQINLDSTLSISTDKAISIGSDGTSSTGGNITLYAGSSDASNGGHAYVISGNGLATPGDVLIISGIDASGFTKAGNIKLLPGFGGGPFSDPKSGFVEISAPLKYDQSIYEKERILSVNNTNISITDIDKNVIINNTGSSVISVNLPDLVGRYDGRKITIQCATFSNSATLTPYGSQKIYHEGSFQSSLVLYKGYSVDLLSSNGNWYVASSKFVNESWKTIGGGGTFQNGQSVPALGYAAVSSTIQVRKTSSGKVAIRGYVNLTNPWVSGQTLFTLPIGYRPGVISLVVTEASASSEIYLFSGGALVVGGYIGATFIGIPEIEISLD